MRLYFAMSNNEPDSVAVLETDHKNTLWSYHYYSKKMDFIKRMRKEYKLNIFVDSGAFSAMTQGVEINIDEYINFLHELKPQFYVGLDDIKDYHITLENQEIMEDAGLKPAPTFHVGEPITVLESFIERYDHIALGGMVGAGSKIIPFLNGVWAVILRKNPKLKVHGFGLTDQEIVKHYPFYSVDSSSYSGGVRFGTMYHWSDAKKCIYNEEFYKFCKRRKIPYEKGDPITGKIRTICIGECCDAYQGMIDYISDYQKKKDFSYLTAQQTLFK
jgi:hypothetical protein